MAKNSELIDEQSDVPGVDPGSPEKQAQDALVGWIMDKHMAWTDYRDTYIAQKWQEFWQLWKGEWGPLLTSPNRKTERSKLISPALQQAVDSGVAELVEAVFGKGRWFDVDSPPEQMKPDPLMTAMRVNLDNDFKLVDIQSSASEIFLNSGIFGTGIGKLAGGMETVFENLIVEPTKRKSSARYLVRVVPVHPAQFAIDPAATGIDDALGMTHTLEVPKHIVEGKMDDGTYWEAELGSGTSMHSKIMPDLNTSSAEVMSDTTLIVEYHGKVPRNFLDLSQPETAPEDNQVVVNLFPEDRKASGAPESSLEASDEMVEAIVTIANNSTLLRAVENPLWMQDRAFLAFPYEKVPGRFWGRGIAEKAYNAQKALDAELRGRIDAMAYSIHPLSAMDATKLPPGFKFEVYPGKNLLTIGPPEQAIKLFNFTGPPPESFSQSGDLERMVQMATGTPDSSASVTQNPKNATATGMSMIAAGVLKRTKRVLANITQMFTSPLVNKAAWRYMQFMPERYPPSEGKFKVHTSLGIMAREFEQQQLSAMLNTAQPGSPGYYLLLKAIYENSSITNKEQMVLAIDQLFQQSTQPSPEHQLAMQKAMIDMQDKKIQRMLEARRVAVEEGRLRVELTKLPSDVAHTESQATLFLSQAESEKIVSNIEAMAHLVDVWESAVNVPTTGATGGASTEQAGTGTGTG